MASKPFLLDVNALIALTWPNHVHHEQTRRWFSIESAAGWATCPMTQCAFVRISSNPAIMREAASPGRALAVLRQLTARADHRFWSDDADFTAAGDLPPSLLQGHRQITDAYLLLLAREHGGLLATLDARLLRSVAGSAWAESLFLIETV